MNVLSKLQRSINHKKCDFIKQIQYFLYSIHFSAQTGRHRFRGFAGQARIPDDLHISAKGGENLSSQTGRNQRLVHDTAGELTSFPSKNDCVKELVVGMTSAGRMMLRTRASFILRENLHLIFECRTFVLF